MAARIAWLLNFDAELELADPDGRPARPMPRARHLALRACITDLVASEDVILDDVILDGTSAAGDVHARASGAAALAALSADTRVQAFCPTPGALRRIAALGLPPPAAPSLSILRTVADRAFCAALGHGLPGAGFVRDMRALQAHVQAPSPTGRYVIKRAFSFAGREQRRVTHGVLDDSTRGFCARSFARGEGVQVEPWLSRSADFSRHGYLTQAGALRLGAPRAQHCDALGRFIGVSTQAAQLTATEAESLERAARQTASALHAAGYFGPFGIDAFRYEQPGGGQGFQPRCELNARFTMGYPRQLLLEALCG